MKAVKPILSIFLLLNLTVSFAQDVTMESLTSEIRKQEKSLVEKKESFDFLSKFITELENSDGDNSTLIKSKKENLKVLEIELLKIKASLFDSNSELRKINSINNLETIPEQMEKLELIEKQVNTKIAEFSLNEKSKLAFKNKTIKYKATIWNTNFSIPIARFNFTKNDDNNKFGDIQMFNSIGAGFGKSWGTMTDFRDEKGDLENSDFANSFSIHGGFLFSAGNEQNVFAPVLTFGVLDFQLGFGVELGTIKADQERAFITLGYAIPLYKLIKGKYLFSKKGRILNEINTDL
ncbi:hypothetical protein [Pedobacter arcticus]|uniref:hypothetical protein n=1 Tax=Pedobacter arcticus TaxID=752140 RepID=UPI00036E53DB|nr:hypothetical protein [Pedobacter arcticus]